MRDVELSIIIPAYNEAARLTPTLEKVLGYVRSQNWTVEVIVVNDGSRDDTAQIVRHLARTNQELQLIDNATNRGKGYSVLSGMRAACGAALVFTDADLSSPIEELPKLLEALHAGADIAIGSRWMCSELQTERQSLPRQLFGRIFNLLTRSVLGLKFKDTQCGFKAFTRRAAQTIVQLQRIERWGFDPEILFIAQKLRLRIAEVPVLWAHKEGTRIHPLADGLRMFLEMVRVRWYSLTGKYDRRRRRSYSFHKNVCILRERYVAKR